jgi:hypothetical protein
MRGTIWAVTLLLPLALLPRSVVAQDGTNDTRPAPHPVTVSLGFQQALELGTRSPTGEPGANYWQQWSDYTIRARLDAQGKRVDGSVRIVYHNRSPDTLPEVYLQLLQNLHAPGVVRNRSQRDVTGGVQLKRVVASGMELDPILTGGFGPMSGTSRGAGYGVSGTVMRLRPSRPVEPGDSLVMEIDFGFAVPQRSSGRMGWSRDNLFFIAYWYPQMQRSSGRMGWSRDNLFFIAYWYPQMAVYDDVVGWHTDPYRGGAEFYMGYGSYDLTVEAPEGWVVAATGRLENAEAVLPAPVLGSARPSKATRSSTCSRPWTSVPGGPPAAPTAATSRGTSRRTTSATSRSAPHAPRCGTPPARQWVTSTATVPWTTPAPRRSFEALPLAGNTRGVSCSTPSTSYRAGRGSTTRGRT